MTTEELIFRAGLFEDRLSSYISGSLIDRVVKKEWPKELDGLVSSIKYQLVKCPTVTPVKHTIRSYRLQNSALESEHILTDVGMSHLDRVFDGLWANAHMFWEKRFCADICRLIENRVTLTKNDTLVPFGPDSDLIQLEDAPRKSLFGRTILRLRRTSLAIGFKLELNPKYDRCPSQVLDFHPDTVHFLFPDLSKWAGEVQFRHLYQAEDRRFFRVVMSVAARPVRTDLGTLYTILPSGVRGWLYKVVWKLLGVKP